MAFDFMFVGLIFVQVNNLRGYVRQGMVRFRSIGEWSAWVCTVEFGMVWYGMVWYGEGG